MPSLNWIGKDAVVHHHKEVPFHLLKCNEKLSVMPKTSEVFAKHPRSKVEGAETSEVSDNLLLQGDNLLALKALLPHYAGQVKCIYIDPPYNTGNEGWVYNDNVNSPEMKAWLGKVVGGEAEDLSRHDKWLCMMYPRLVLLREMLKEDGVIFISIADDEVSNLRAIMDEIFTSNNFLAEIVWQKSYSPRNNVPTFSASHEYIVCYARNANRVTINRLPTTDAQRGRYSNPDNDPRGDWKPSDLSVSLVSGQRGAQFQKTGKGANLYSLTSPSGRIINPPRSRCWVFSKDKFEEFDQDNRIWWGQNGASVPQLKRFFSEIEGGLVPQTIWGYQEVGHMQEASQEIKKLFVNEEGVAFPTPKPVRLLDRIIQLATNPGDLILDSFAGSGTTGHAVLQMNKEDGGNRRFILVEMDENISKNITAERLKRVSQGYEWKDQKGNKKKEEGLGGGFRFCELGETLFDAEGQIQKEVTFEDLARHVYFTETGVPLPERLPKSQRLRKSEASPLLGIHNGVAVYLLYNGILKDKSRNGGNVLTRPLLAELPEHDGAKVIYGNGTLLSENTLRSLNITFRQVPYEIKVS